MAELRQRMKAGAELAGAHVGKASRGSGEQEGVEEGCEVKGLLGLRRGQQYIVYQLVS